MIKTTGIRKQFVKSDCLYCIKEMYIIKGRLVDNAEAEHDRAAFAREYTLCLS